MERNAISAASSQVLLDLPYPPVKIHCCSRANGFAMLDNMGGMNSEMTVVSQYLYSSLVLEACDLELSSIFAAINRVEMHHLQIFGQLATQLGMDPKLWTRRGCQPVYWTPAYHRYSSDRRAILRCAIQGEEEAIEKYRAQCRQICDPCIQAILQRIILDEKRHIEIFRQCVGCNNK